VWDGSNIATAVLKYFYSILYNRTNEHYFERMKVTMKQPFFSENPNNQQFNSFSSFSYPTCIYFPVRTYSRWGWKGETQKRKKACRYTNKLNYDKLFRASQRNNPSKLLQLKKKKKCCAIFLVHDRFMPRPPSSRHDGVTVHFKIPSDYNIVYTFHTKTVSHPQLNTALPLRQSHTSQVLACWTKYGQQS